jgi:hypothetical protein
MLASAAKAWTRKHKLSTMSPRYVKPWSHHDRGYAACTVDGIHRELRALGSLNANDQQTCSPYKVLLSACVLFEIFSNQPAIHSFSSFLVCDLFPFTLFPHSFLSTAGQFRIFAQPPTCILQSSSLWSSDSWPLRHSPPATRLRLALLRLNVVTWVLWLVWPRRWSEL